MAAESPVPAALGKAASASAAEPKAVLARILGLLKSLPARDQLAILERVEVYRMDLAEAFCLRQRLAEVEKGL